MPNPIVTPLAQNFTIAARVPDPGLYFFHDPNLARLIREDGAALSPSPLTRHLQKAARTRRCDDSSPSPRGEADSAVFGGNR